RDVYIAHVRKEHEKQMKKHPCYQCDKSFSSSHSLCRHNWIKHKGIRKVCAVCGFTTKNLLQFHEHIPQHKSDGSSYQRRECGLCYTSHVSLSSTSSSYTS
ncbi:hypothetical protein H8959_011471, partial [Pygathrix nigripes]